MGRDLTWKIVTDDNGSRHASNGDLAMSVGEEGKLWMRRAIKRALSDTPEHVCWLVGELDGVRCYVHTGPSGTHLVLTRDDLYP